MQKKVPPTPARGAAKVAPASVANATSTHKRASFVDSVTAALGGSDAGATPAQLVASRPVLQRASAVHRKAAHELVPDDARPMADALLATMANFRGKLGDVVDAWALAFGLARPAEGEQQGQRASQRMPVSVVLALVAALAGDAARLQKLARFGLAARLVAGLLISYTDMHVLHTVSPRRKHFFFVLGCGSSPAHWPPPPHSFCGDRLSDILVMAQFFDDEKTVRFAWWTFGSLALPVDFSRNTLFPGRARCIGLRYGPDPHSC